MVVTGGTLRTLLGPASVVQKHGVQSWGRDERIPERCAGGNGRGHGGHRGPCDESRRGESGLCSRCEGPGWNKLWVAGEHKERAFLPLIF